MEEFLAPESENKSITGEQGRLSAILGVLAMALAMTGPCTCYLGFIAAIILGLIGQITSRTALAESTDGEEIAYANVGKWTSLIAMIWSLFVLLLLVLYILLYIVIVFSVLSL